MLGILVAFISVTASSAGKYDSFKGVRIKNDNAVLSMGATFDVNIARSGGSKLSIDATVGVQKNLEVTGTANFKAGIQNSGFVFSGSLDDGGNNGQWWPLLKMSKAKDGGYNPHWFAMTVMSNHNSAIDVFKLSGHWSDRSDHKSKHGDFHGFTAQRQGTACTYSHACDIAFQMSNCGQTNGDMYILVAKALASQNTGKSIHVLDVFHKGKDTWKWAPYTSKTLPAGCKKLAKPSKPTPGTGGSTKLPALQVTGPATFAGAATFNNVITAHRGMITRGFVYSGSLDDGGVRGQWWPLLKMSKAKDGGYNSHWFSMTVLTQHNSASDIFDLSGHWSDRSDHASKHGDFHGFTAQRRGTHCTYSHACDVAFQMSNCGQTNGDMYILVAKALASQNTGKAVYVLDAFHKGKDTWKWGPYTSKTLPAGCKKLAKPSKPTPGTAPGGRRLQEMDSRVEELQQQLSDANEKIMAQARELQRQKDDLAAIKAALKL